MYSNERLYRNIRAVIKHKKKPIGDLELEVGISQGYLSRSEKSNTTPNISTVTNIAEQLGCSIDFLVLSDAGKSSDNMLFIEDFIAKLIEDTKSGDIVWSSDEKSVCHASISNTEDVYVSGAPVDGAWKKLAIWFQSPAAPVQEGAEETATTEPEKPEKLIVYDEDAISDKYMLAHVMDLAKTAKTAADAPYSLKAMQIIKDFLAVNNEKPAKTTDSLPEPINDHDSSPEPDSAPQGNPLQDDSEETPEVS